MMKCLFTNSYKKIYFLDWVMIMASMALILFNFQVCRLINGQPKCACPINYSRDPLSKSCTVINECDYPQLNDCHPSAECIDQPSSYICKCRPGFKDVSPDKPGRVCQPCEFKYYSALCIE